MTDEQYTARTEAIVAQTAAMREATAAMLASFTAPGPRRTDEELWALYASARGCSNYCRTDAEAASFANDMLKRHRAIYPK